MSVNSSLYPPALCTDSSTASYIFTGFVITKVLLCSPLSVSVLYVGHQQWRQQHSTKNMSHSDVFTYNKAALVLSSLVAGIFYLYGNYTHFAMLTLVALYVFNSSFPGEMCFHSLTCVECYLAVVHPIIYRRLRHSSGVRIRNISIGCVWLLCLAWIGVKRLCAPSFPIIPFFSILSLALLVVTFCSLSVLCALTRPGPGDGGADEKRVDQSKQRAFHTIMAILAVLLFWFIGIMVCFALQVLPLVSYQDGCILMMFGIWFSIPSSPLLPLLFLHRAGRLPCCRRSNEK